MQRLTLYIPRIRQIKGHPQNKEQYLRIIHIELKFEEFNRFSFCGCPGYGGSLPDCRAGFTNATEPLNLSACILLDSRGDYLGFFEKLRTYFGICGQKR